MHRGNPSFGSNYSKLQTTLAEPTPFSFEQTQKSILDKYTNRLIQTETQQLLETTTIQDVRAEYTNYKQSCEEKRIVIYKPNEDRTVFLKYKHRESTEYVQDVMARLSDISFRQYRMITLTTDPARFGIGPMDYNSADRLKKSYMSIKKQWNQLRTAMKKRYGDFRYLCVIEFTKSNLPHLHVICDIAQRVDMRIIRANWSQGRIFHVSRKFNNGLSAKNYVMKYIHKQRSHDYNAMLWKYRIRTYSLSRNAIHSYPLEKYEHIKSEWVFVGTDWQENIVRKCGLLFIEASTHYNGAYEPNT